MARATATATGGGVVGTSKRTSYISVSSKHTNLKVIEFVLLYIFIFRVLNFKLNIFVT